MKENELQSDFHALHEYWDKKALAEYKNARINRWKLLITWQRDERMSDLEFRLYWSIPASFYYKFKKELKESLCLPAKFKRYAI